MFSSYTPSSKSVWKWVFKVSALPKRWIRVLVERPPVNNNPEGKHRRNGRQAALAA
jgi:hypothetical protein